MPELRNNSDHEARVTSWSVCGLPHLVVALLLLGMAPLAAAEEPAPAADRDTERKATWLDTRYDQFSNSADALAVWVDGFFNQTRSVEDSASSIVRIRPQYEWDEDDGGDWKLRATGRLYLPAASDRLSIVFLGEEGDFGNEFYDPGLASDGSSTVGVQYRLREEARSRLDLTLGLKAGPKGKVGAKYRYQMPLWKRNRVRFSEEVFWIGGDGFGTLSRVDIDRRLAKDTLLRWANKAEYSEESNGIEWNSRVALIKRLSEKSAFRSYVFIRGETDPRFLKSRGVGVAVRRQFLRRWLFWEVEPRYEWRKDRAGASRDGVFGAEFRLELVLGEREWKG